jgi:hypothetical protein
MATSALSIRKHFARLPDPRINRRKRHPLTDIVVIALCAVICGPNNHWQLGVTFREDDSRIRERNAAGNFALLRVALSLLKRHPDQGTIPR